MSTIILAILTFLFALLMAPYAMYVGRSKSITELKHEIQSIGGKYIMWGKKNNLVMEYFVFGSIDPNAEVILMLNGVFCPGDLWGKFSGQNSADSWGKRLNLKVICTTNTGLGCSSVPNSENLLSFDRIKDFMTKVLEMEKVDKFYIAGLSQGSHVATVVADIFSNSKRVQGVIMMCPYMPFGKAHEVFNNGPKVKGNYLMEHPLKGDISVVQALMPGNFVLLQLTQKILPIVLKKVLAKLILQKMAVRSSSAPSAWLSI